MAPYRTQEIERRGEFWRELGDEHRWDLDAHGSSSIKRNEAAWRLAPGALTP